MDVDIMNLFQSFRTILCLCPCCNDVVRFSDLHIQYKGKVAKTWLDEHEVIKRSLEEKESEFEEGKEQLRKRAIERGRKKISKRIQRSMHTELSKYNPYDIKTVLHPIDFVVFDGMDSNKMKNVIFLAKDTNNNNLNKTRSSIQSTINKEAYEWKTARVDIDGSIKYE